MHAGPKACIATTLVNADQVLDSFIRYHLAIGFTQIFLFFDDPADSDLQRRAATYPGVVSVATDDRLRERWMTTASSKRDGWLAMIDSEVMVRQVLNVEVALQMARERGLGWLLHIDIDELFFTPNCSVPTHFALAEQGGMDSITYLNLESVPEAPEIRDYFREITLFKTSPHLARRNALATGEEWRTTEQLEVYESVPGLAEKYFLFYKNGKSAVRVRDDVFANGVHNFAARDRELAHSVSSDPVILHYACCGFEHFWNKYRTLGDIPDSWFGQFDIAREIGRFHLDARDVVGTGDRDKALEFYRNRVMITDPADVEKMLGCDLLRRVTGPQWLLGQIDSGNRP